MRCPRNGVNSIALLGDAAEHRLAAGGELPRHQMGRDCACSRQRSNVPAPTSTSRATTSSAALSGGSNRATALSLNACPY